MNNQDNVDQYIVVNQGEGESTPGPDVSDSPVFEPVKEGKKSNILVLALGAVALIASGLAIYFGIMYFGKSKPSYPATPDSQVVSKNDMAYEYKEVKDVMMDLVDGIENSWSSNPENGSGLTYKLEEANTFVPMDLDLEVEISNSYSVETNVNTLKNKLTGAGFSSIGILPFIGSAGPKIDGYLNSEDNIVCGVYADVGAVLTCAKTDWSWLTEEEKTLVKELSTAYYNKTGGYPTVVYGLGGKIKDSEYEPYQSLQVAIGGGYALFYRVSPDDEWQYFAGGQAPLDCSDYNTEDLQKAFAGNVCYNGLEASEVRPE
ncbi:hypothetical protein IKX73_00340 [Candidatus Saccharibacteria bacterium]|nr:hypothetical protein [Candidatus Saccharibacteria bacterium]